MIFGRTMIFGRRVQDIVWPDKRVTMLMELYAAGESASKIANALNTAFGTAYSRNAVIGKAHRLGLLPRREAHRVKTIREGKPHEPRPARSGMSFVFGRLPWRPPQPSQLPPPPQATGDGDYPYRCGLHDLTNETCRWPVGNPGTPDFFFCGEPSANLAARFPYCGRHERLAWDRPRRHP
jgi:GcrA cell cycle regulator